MITLLTAVPGAGKTAFAVKMLMDDPLLKGRPIFTNITGLKLPHFPIDADWVKQWHKNAPPEALILFDECQDVFPPRHVSREAPDYVSELTKHRKDYGVDFFLITQNPSLIDHAVKALVGRYLHIREDGLTPMLYEAKEIVDFREKSVREIHTGKPYSIPKKVFELYTSSQVHNKKPRRKLPTAAYVFAIAILLAGVAGWRAVSSISEKVSPIAAHETEQSGGLPPLLSSSASSTLKSDSAVPNRIVEATTPTDDHNPLSAPLYAPVAPPVVAPEIQGCISSKRSCTCYSQQQTPIWIPDEQCRQRAAGLYYDPYRQPPTDKPVRTVEPRQADPATAPEGGSSEGAAPIPSPPPAGEAQA